VLNYISMFYNSYRLHSYLGYMSLCMANCQFIE
jgi:hypothetical protein